MLPGETRENQEKPGESRRNPRDKMVREGRTKEKPGTHGEIGKDLLGTSGKQGNNKGNQGKAL